MGAAVAVGEVALDRYRIEAVIGSGAMGTVYRARHVRVGREVAIKVLHGHLVRDPNMVRRFDREAAIAARLSHRHLVGVLDVGETARGDKLMVLELARGETLSAIAARGPLDGARVARLVAQLLRGLEHAHDAGLVHRDLKPENIIVEHDERGAEQVRIVDFGIAVLREQTGDIASARLTEYGTVLGTPPYMAPEQARGEPPDPRTDLFAVGVIVYELLAGKTPFDGSALEVVLANVKQDPPPIAERAPGVVVHPQLEAFARRLMARPLRDRFASAREALEALARIAQNIKPPRKPRRLPLALAATLVSLGALLGFWLAS